MSDSGGGRRGGKGDRNRIPVDVVLSAIYAVLVGAVALTGSIRGPAMVVLAGPLVLFLPGYALLSVLVPGSANSSGDAVSDPPLGSVTIGWFERASLSVGLSVAVLPILVVLLAALGYQPTRTTVSVTLVGFVVLASALGAARRLALPEENRYGLPVDRWLRELRTFAGSPRATRVDKFGAVVLGVLVVLALAGMSVGLAAPPDGESYTEVALLTPSEDGPVAAGYPDAVANDEPLELVLSIENDLGRPTAYEYVVVLDRVSSSADGTEMTVLERDALERGNVSLADDETATRTLSLVPSMLGSDLRLSVFVYEEAAPEFPSRTTADEHLYIWVDVEDSG
ncbi:DUF1616 domain-containing protein [Halobaculum roseum]|uniref:DUF1616 domain-containing protein n=1 Tax=Halobaculum roseum TaxID=2175149 RepID=A0ABD5MY43_9EURY|nr:DUF1616 domain-containing protein [Halobaculum roseum]QZY04440.1 DUF1616 domain-containing protein [Halobaculum roseum]